MRLIDADALVEKLNLAIIMMSGMIKMLNAEDDEGLQMELKAYRDIRDGIKEEPTIDPERKTGKWTDDNACQFCGFQPWYERDIHSLSFCPHCGADMRGEQDG